MSCIFLYFQLQSITASLYPILLRIVSWVVLRWKVTYLTAVCFTDVCWRVPLKHMQGMDIIWIIFHRACQVVIASIIVATVVQVMKLCMLCYLLLLLELQIRPTPCHVSVLSFTIALYYKHTHTHTYTRFTALWILSGHPGEPGPEETFTIHPLTTILVINRPLSASSI